LENLSGRKSQRIVPEETRRECSLKGEQQPQKQRGSATVRQEREEAERTGV
jgi:hypothetical protein